MANATIRDVAREAEVSVASVSRVLNGSDQVRAALKLRVEDAARRLGYVPHAGARSLSLARTGAVGVVLPDLHGEFFSEILRGMDREASARGLHLLLSNMHADAALGIEALKAMRGRVDGLVVMAPHVDADRLCAHLPSDVPAVLVNCAAHRQPRDELRIDNAVGAAAMVDHLVASGRRAIVHVAGPNGNVDADERARGYAAAMRRHALVPTILPGDFHESAGAAAARAIVDGSLVADALFAANDMMAIGALVALRDAGVDVPGSVAVAGFDDVPLARLVTPALSTMRIDIAALGARAVARLSGVIDGADVSPVELHTPQLIIRASTRSATDTSVNDTSAPANGGNPGNQP